MVLTIVPRFVPSLKRCFHQKIKEAAMRASLKSYSTDNVDDQIWRVWNNRTILFVISEYQIFKVSG
jgi:hypothetical protein